MKRKLFSTLTILVLASIMISPVSAGGNVGFSKAQFSLGNSLDVSGVLTGVGGYSDGIVVDLLAAGTPVVTCMSHGGNAAPGQNPSQVSASDVELVQNITKKGTASVALEAEPTLTAQQAGCPNKNWTAHIDFVFWTSARITVTDPSTAPAKVLLQQNYTCVTTRNPDSVSCEIVR